MTRNKQTIEVVTVSQERRGRWSAEEKAALVRQTHEPGMNVSLVARKHGVGARVIPPFLDHAKSRGQAAKASFCFGVMPPSAMLGRS